jgi:hypothetical protein
LTLADNFPHKRQNQKLFELFRKTNRKSLEFTITKKSNKNENNMLTPFECRAVTNKLRKKCVPYAQNEEKKCRNRMGALKQGHQRKKILTEWIARFFDLTDAKAYAICVRQELMGG